MKAGEARPPDTRVEGVPLFPKGRRRQDRPHRCHLRTEARNRHAASSTPVVLESVYDRREELQGVGGTLGDRTGDDGFLGYVASVGCTCGFCCYVWRVAFLAMYDAWPRNHQQREKREESTGGEGKTKTDQTRSHETRRDRTTEEKTTHHQITSHHTLLTTITLTHSLSSTPPPPVSIPLSPPTPPHPAARNPSFSLRTITIPKYLS
jgi:hypothetical protein